MSKDQDIEDLRHDLARHVDIATTYINQCEAMDTLLKEMDEYLDTNSKTVICASSIFHKQIKVVRAEYNDKGEKE